MRRGRDNPRVTAPRLCAASDRNTALYGGPDLLLTDREIAWPLFADTRVALAAKGYDGVWCEMPGTDLAEAVCLFDPARATILRVVDAHDTFGLEALEDPQDDSVVDFAVTLEKTLEVARRAEIVDPLP